MSQVQSPSFSSSVSPNIRNFKELYQIKYQEKQLSNLQGSQLLQQGIGQQPPSTPSSLSGGQQSKDQILQASQLMNPSSPTNSVKFPSFSASQKQKLFLNNTNIIPKKVQQKAKMISLNLQNASQNQNQSARNAENSSMSSQSQTGNSHHGSISNGPTIGFPSSANLTRHQSYQSPTSGSSQGTSGGSAFLSKQASNQHLQNNQAGQQQQQLQQSQMLLQQAQAQAQLYTGNKHRGSAGSYASLFSHTNNSNSNNSSNNVNNNTNNQQNSQQQQQMNSLSNNNNNSHTNSNGNISDKDQKKYEQYQLLEKYKGTPFLNYMFLNQNSSPIHSPNNLAFLKDAQQSSQAYKDISQSSYKELQSGTFKDVSLLPYSQSQPQSHVSSALHSRNQSQNVLLLQQQQQQQQQQPQPQPSQQQPLERKQSSRIENKNSIVAAPSPTNAISSLQSNTAGIDTSKSDSLSSTRWSHNQMSKNSFHYQYVIGKGGFGKVWRVEHKKNKQPFAMKEMSKSKIITKRSVNSVMSERHLLSQLKHPFLVNMNFAFQDRDNLYLVMDLVSGGDLRFHIGRHRRFKESQTKFFVACIVIALEYLHSKNVIHRDIKPENLVLDTEGYVKVTDLGVARIWKPENSQDTSGTPGYMAPEVMCRQNHGIAVDYFAVGVIAYEFMMGRRPYLGRNRKEIRDQILSKQVQIKKHEIPDGWSIEAADFINRMIQRKPVNRLGVNGPEEVKQHPWIKSFPWDKLLNRQLDAPFIPQAIEDNYDYRNQISADGEDTNEELIQQNAILLRKNSVQNLFSGYNYDSNDIQRQPSLNQNQLNGTLQQGSSSPVNYQTGSTHSTNNTNIPSDRSQSALNARKSPSSFA